MTYKGTVYLVRSSWTGLVKVGWTKSKSTKGRIDALRTGAGPLSLVGYIGDVAIQAESQIHHDLNHRCVDGEWFSLSENQARAVVSFAGGVWCADEWPEPTLSIDANEDVEIARRTADRAMSDVRLIEAENARLRREAWDMRCKVYDLHKEATLTRLTKYVRGMPVWSIHQVPSALSRVANGLPRYSDDRVFWGEMSVVSEEVLTRLVSEGRVAIPPDVIGAKWSRHYVEAAE